MPANVPSSAPSALMRDRSPMRRERGCVPAGGAPGADREGDQALTGVQTKIPGLTVPFSLCEPDSLQICKPGNDLLSGIWSARAFIKDRVL